MDPPLMTQTTNKKLYFKTGFLSKAIKNKGLRLLKENQLQRYNIEIAGEVGL